MRGVIYTVILHRSSVGGCNKWLEGSGWLASLSSSHACTFHALHCDNNFMDLYPNSEDVLSIIDENRFKVKECWVGVLF